MRMMGWSRWGRSGRRRRVGENDDPCEAGPADLEGARRLWRRFAAHADDGVEEVGE